MGLRRGSELRVELSNAREEPRRSLYPVLSCGSSPKERLMELVEQGVTAPKPAITEVDERAARRPDPSDPIQAIV